MVELVMRARGRDPSTVDPSYGCARMRWSRAARACAGLARADPGWALWGPVQTTAVPERAARKERTMASMHDFQMKSITGEMVDLSDYEGQVCLIVNVASE